MLALSGFPVLGLQVLKPSYYDPRVRSYHKRRAHKKTKAGCLGCKAKRVKCDEGKPICARCRRNNRACCYGRPELQPSKSPSPDPLSAVTVLPFPLSPASHAGATNGTPTLHLLAHLRTHWQLIFPFDTSVSILDLSKEQSLVRSALLALSACHLRHVSPGEKKHRIAEYATQALALQEYQLALNCPSEELGQDGINGLMLSALLLNVLAFSLTQAESDTGHTSPASSESENDPSASWVFSSRDDRLSWLALQAGMRSLIRSKRSFLEHTMSTLTPLICPSMAPTDWMFVRMARGISLAEAGVPDTWVRFFGLTDDLTVDHHDTSSKCEPKDRQSAESIFHPAVIILSELRDITPHSQESVFKGMQFLSKVGPELRFLLFKRDERALWLLGYWLGIMQRFNTLWWCEGRVRRDFEAVKLWLEQARVNDRTGAEGELWRVMTAELKAAPRIGSMRSLPPFTDF